MTLEELQKQIDALLYREFLRSGLSLETTVAFVKNSNYNLGDLLVHIDVNKDTSQVSVDRIVAKVLENIVDVKTTKSLREEVVDNLENVILRGKTKTRTTGVQQLRSSSGKFQSVEQYIANNKVLRDVKGKFTSKAAFAEQQKHVPLKDLKGKFTSPAKLANIIQASLHDSIQKNMDTPRLIYRTGRSARNVKLSALQYDNKEAKLTAYLTYMKYPYQTFEPGYKQGSIHRDPRSLIDKSVRDIAVNLTKARMKVIHV